ncbi:MAG: DUF5666 domain-containing protein [bacterium]
MKRCFWFIGVLALLLASVGCGGGGGGSLTGGSSGKVNVYATDATVAGLDALWIQIGQIEARNSSGVWSPLLSFNPPVELNVLELSSVRQFLGGTTLPAGTYDRVRLTLASVRAVQSGVSSPVPLPSNVFEIPATVNVGSNGSVEMVIDFQGTDGLVGVDGSGFHFDHTKVVIIIAPTPPNIPPPPDPTDPANRAVVLKGEVAGVNAGNQSFTVDVHHSQVTGAATSGLDYNLPAVTVFTSSLTQFDPPGKSFADLAIGADVAVVGMPTAGGIQALQVSLPNEEVHFNAVEGLVLEVLYDLKLIKIGVGDTDPCMNRVPCWLAAEGVPDHPTYPVPWNFTWVAVTDSTSIASPDGQALSLSDIRPNEYLRVEGQWESDFFVASKITVFETPPGPNEISGAIFGIDPDTHQLQVGNRYDYGWGGGGSVGGGVTAGGNAGDPTTGGGFLPPDPPYPYYSVTVQVSNSTTIAKSDGTPLNFSDLQIGMIIHAVGGFDANNIFQADKILVEEFQPPRDQVYGSIVELRPDASEFVLRNDIGILASSGGTNIYPPPPTMPDVTVKVTPETKIQDSNGSELAFADLQIGDQVSAEGNFDANTPNYFVATSVWVYRNIPQPGYVEGTIQSADASSRVLLIVPSYADRWVGPANPQIQVHVKDDAAITNSSGESLTFSQLLVGDYVGAQGEFGSDGIFQADAVFVMEPPPPPAIDFRGVITSKTQDAIVIATEDGQSLRVAVNSETQIVDEQGNPLAFADLHERDHVRGYGYPSPNNPDIILAEFIQRSNYQPPPPLPGIEICGGVASIDLEHHTFVLVTPDGHAITVIVTQETRIIINDQPGTFEQLQANQPACVGGKPAPNHERTIIASFVVQPPPHLPGITVCGGIVSIDYEHHTFVLVNPDGKAITVIVTHDTRIIINGELGSFDDLHMNEPACVGGHPDPHHDHTIIAAFVVQPPPSTPGGTR